VRVVPNLYPAFERQEVVVHSPDHKRSFADLDGDEAALVAEAWRQRRRAHPEGYLHALVNEGRDAGASLPHSHSQLVWFRDPPPAVAVERRSVEALNELHRQREELEVISRDEVVAFCPRASRTPYEVLITSADVHEDAFRGDGLTSGLLLLRDVISRLRAVEGHVPWNAWLHYRDDDWHIEVVPRTTVLAGIELGAEIYVNTLAPEEAARRLREAM
jgi:UDPglucose--hexose-1-phosphate uridylyltransferase